MVVGVAIDFDTDKDGVQPNTCYAAAPRDIARQGSIPA
jgi:hypothetical protein